jgi:hypothetical protein
LEKDMTSEQSVISEGISSHESEATQSEIDPAQFEYLRAQLTSEQNLAFGLLGGAAASLLGAAAWATLTVVTGYQIGFMAIGIGIFVGLAIRATGKGITGIFGLIGAALSLFACALGNLAAVTAIAAQDAEISFLSAASQLTPGLAQQLMIAFFSPMDLLFYGIAIYEGHRFAFRQVSSEEREQLTSGGATVQ